MLATSCRTTGLATLGASGAATDVVVVVREVVVLALVEHPEGRKETTSKRSASLRLCMTYLLGTAQPARGRSRFVQEDDALVRPWIRLSGW